MMKNSTILTYFPANMLANQLFLLRKLSKCPTKPLHGVDSVER